MGKMELPVAVWFLFFGLLLRKVQGEYDMPELYDGQSAPEDFEYPCPDLGEDCIRQYLEGHSKCSPVASGNEVSAINRTSQVIYLTYCNMTVHYADALVSGLDGKITTFSCNKKTKTVVLSVFFQGVRIDVEDCRFSYHILGEQSCVKGGNLFAKYTVTLTAEIPVKDDMMDIDRARITAYVWDTHPEFQIAESIREVTHPQVAKSMECLLTDLPTGLQHTFTSEAQSFFYAWAKCRICDFHKPLSYIDYHRY